MSLPLQGLRMLVVEDEAMVAMLVEDLLIDLGCVVVDVAGTLEQGLRAAAASASPIDGAILDVNLGGSKVFPIADVLEARGVKFIFATGYGVLGVESRYAGHKILSKPFQLRALEETLVAALT
jgi:DNA-binding response OmpR family regulator